MTGLDIAAAAVSVIVLWNLIVSQLLPFIRDSANADETAKRFHREICEFNNILVIIEATPGARAEFDPQRSFDISKMRATKKHTKECKNTIEEIERELPKPKDRNRNFT